MCESNVYIQDGKNEIMIMESVDTIEPYENGLRLMDTLGKELFIKAKIKDMSLLNHRIILEKIPLDNL